LSDQLPRATAEQQQAHSALKIQKMNESFVEIQNYLRELQLADREPQLAEKIHEDLPLNNLDIPDPAAPDQQAELERKMFYYRIYEQREETGFVLFMQLFFRYIELVSDKKFSAEKRSLSLMTFPLMSKKDAGDLGCITGSSERAQTALSNLIDLPYVDAKLLSAHKAFVKIWEPRILSLIREGNHIHVESGIEQIVNVTDANKNFALDVAKDIPMQLAWQIYRDYVFALNESLKIVDQKDIDKLRHVIESKRAVLEQIKKQIAEIDQLIEQSPEKKERLTAQKEKLLNDEAAEEHKFYNWLGHGEVAKEARIPLDLLTSGSNPVFNGIDFPPTITPENLLPLALSTEAHAKLPVNPFDAGAPAEIASLIMSTNPTEQKIAFDALNILGDPTWVGSSPALFLQVVFNFYYRTQDTPENRNEVVPIFAAILQEQITKLDDEIKSITEKKSMIATGEIPEEASAAAASKNQDDTNQSMAGLELKLQTVKNLRSSIKTTVRLINANYLGQQPYIAEYIDSLESPDVTPSLVALLESNATFAEIDSAIKAMEAKPAAANDELMTSFEGFLGRLTHAPETDREVTKMDLPGKLLATVHNPEYQKIFHRILQHERFPQHPLSESSHLFIFDEIKNLCKHLTHLGAKYNQLDFIEYAQKGFTNAQLDNRHYSPQALNIAVKDELSQEHIESRTALQLTTVRNASLLQPIFSNLSQALPTIVVGVRQGPRLMAETGILSYLLFDRKDHVNFWNLINIFSPQEKIYLLKQPITKEQYIQIPSYADIIIRGTNGANPNDFENLLSIASSENGELTKLQVLGDALLYGSPEIVKKSHKLLSTTKNQKPVLSFQDLQDLFYLNPPEKDSKVINIAAEKGDHEFIKELIVEYQKRLEMAPPENKYPVSTLFRGVPTTPLHIAAKLGFPEVMRAVTENVIIKADEEPIILMRNEKKITPAYYAAFYEKIESMKEIKRQIVKTNETNGTNYNLLSNCIDRVTPIEAAVTKKDSQMLDWLFYNEPACTGYLLKSETIAANLQAIISNLSKTRDRLNGPQMTANQVIECQKIDDTTTAMMRYNFLADFSQKLSARLDFKDPNQTNFITQTIFQKLLRENKTDEEKYDVQKTFIDLLPSLANQDTLNKMIESIIEKSEQQNVRTDESKTDEEADVAIRIADTIRNMPSILIGNQIKSPAAAAEDQPTPEPEPSSASKAQVKDKEKDDGCVLQ